MKAEVARADLTAHAAWRVAHVPNGRIDESEVQDNLVEKKSFLQGCDRGGHPVVIVRVREHIPKVHGGINGRERDEFLNCPENDC